MYARIFVASESDVANLPSFARFKERGVRSLRMKDTVRIVKPDDLVVLDQINVGGLQTLKRCVELFAGFFPGSSIDLGHHKRTVAVAVTQRPAHAFLTLSIVVVPTVVEKVDASIDGRTNNANCQLLVNSFQTEMPAAYPDCRHLFSGAAQCSINHLATPFRSPASWYEMRAIAAQSHSPNPRPRAPTN